MFRRLTQTQCSIASRLCRTYLTPKSKYADLGSQPGLVAKRLIDVVGKRLREIDPQRWDGQPVTFKTHWRDEGGSFFSFEVTVT
jgi:hypothetical protein